MLTTIYLLRHGETDWNKNSIFQGHTDIELNENGISNAKKVADNLAEINIDQIYSSDLKRAVKTASFTAADKKLFVNKDQRIREISFGVWEGLKYKEIKDKYSQKLSQWQKNPEEIAPAKGENMLDFKLRVDNFFKEILNNHQGEKILVVTHGGVIKLFLTIIFSMELKKFWQFQIDNNSLTKIKFYDADPILSKLNFTNQI